MFKWLLLAFCIINPLFYSFNVEARQAQEFCFQVSGLILIMSGLMFSVKSEQSPLEKKFNLSLFSLFAWIICVFLMYKEGWSVAINAFIGIGIYLTIIRSLEKKDIEFVIKGVLWIAVYAIFYLALQFLSWDMRGQILKGKAGGIPSVSIFYLEACYGMYITLALSMLLGISCINDMQIEFKNMSSYIYGKCNLYVKNTLKFILINLYIMGLLFACWWGKSTGVFAAFFIAVLAYLWFKKRIFFWGTLIPSVIITFCFVFLYDTPMGMQGSRIDMWKKVIQDSHIKPLGAGLDSFRLDQKEGAVRYFKYAYNNTTERVKKINGQWVMQNNVPQEFIQSVNEGKNALDFWDNCHNFYIQVLYEMGLPAIIIIGFILYFFFNIFKFCKKTYITTALFCSLLSLLIFNTTQFPLFLARIGHLVPVIGGMFITSVREDVVKP